jgi:hypothetical protein
MWLRVAVRWQYRSRWTQELIESTGYAGGSSQSFQNAWSLIIVAVVADSSSVNLSAHDIRAGINQAV